MTKRYTYTYTTTMSRGGDEPTWEGEVEVSYEVAWGSPESGRFGPPEDYDPGCGDVIEAIHLEKVDGKSRPWGMYGGYILDEDDEFAREVIEELESSEDHEAAMIAEAVEASQPDPDYLSDLRREDRDERF